MRPVVGWRCGEVDEGGVRRGASTVGASGGGDEWGVGEGGGVAPTLRSGLTSECTLGTGGGGLKASGRCPRRRSTWRPRAGEG